VALFISDWFTTNDIECSHLKAANDSFPKHTHDEYIISANLSGTEHIWVEGKTALVRQGDVTIYNPGTIQASQFGSEPVEFCSIHLPQELLRQVVEKNNLTSNHHPPVLAEGLLHNPALFAAICRYTLTSIDAEEEEQNLFWLLGNLLDSRTEDGEQQTKAITLALEFMRDNLNQKINLDLLARASGMSKFHFVRLFRQRMGMPPLQYHMQLRLLAARNLLRQNLNTLDVAMTLGFYDQSHFINAFRKMMGITPHHYSLSLHIPRLSHNKLMVARDHYI
jgi:AraC-like DNA-binding protein